MTVKKTCALPTVRCDEAMKARTHRAANALGVSVTAFIHQAVVEKIARMESEWHALNSVFLPGEPGKQ